MGLAFYNLGLNFSEHNCGTVTPLEDVAVTAISLSAETPFSGMSQQIGVVYTPSNTNQTSVTWSIVSGGEYATISNSGVLTILEGANGNDVVVQAVSTYDSTIVATKTINVTYELIIDTLDSIAISGDSSVVGTSANYDVTYSPEGTIRTGVTWSIESGSEYASITSGGVLSILEGASANTVTIKATSTYDSSVYVTMDVTVTYFNGITFEDSAVKALCVANWDTNSDGEISYSEAAAATNIGTIFSGNTTIEKFDEFQYFTNAVFNSYKAFAGCTSLKYITLPSSVTSLKSTTAANYGTFYNCTALERINLQNVTSFTCAFANCTSLSDIGSLSGSLTSIGNYSFQNCSSLSNITLPSSLTSIGNYAFNNCSALSSITIPEGVTSIGEQAFEGCTSLASLSLPSTLTTIAKRAFRRCCFTSITIPEGVTAINESIVGANTALLSVEFPSTVTSFGVAICSGCTSLTEIVINATTPPTVTSTSFTKCNDAPIYVPDAYVDTYKAADVWSDYASRIYAMSSRT